MSQADAISGEPGSNDCVPLCSTPTARPAHRRWATRAARLLESIRAVPKTLLFNLRYFPLPDALRIPVVVRHTVHLKRLGGTLHLANDWRCGGIKLGFGDEGHFDRARERTMWDVSGRVTLGQGVRILHGARLSVGTAGALTLGDGVLLNSGATVICHRRVSIGRQTRIAWESLIMDSDFHQIVDAAGGCSNEDAPVRIGEHVWIGASAIVLKGSTIADGCVVGAGALVNRRYDETAALIAGNPGRIVRHGMVWRG
jgi:serine acetyltransferase